MVTMIIVEDESFERNALKQCIDWNLIGVEIVGEAKSGYEAVELIFRVSALFPRSEDLTGYAVLLLLSAVHCVDPELCAIDLHKRTERGI